MQKRVESSESPVVKEASMLPDLNGNWDPPAVIPVAGKMPSVFGFSYAIGASAISAPLSDLPMFGAMSLWYSNQTSILTMELPLREFPLVRIACTNYPAYQSMKSGSADDRTDVRYTIEVLLTPFQHREFIQRLILKKAIPLVRDWLTNLEPANRTIRRIVGECWYEVATGVVDMREETKAERE